MNVNEGMSFEGTILDPVCNKCKRRISDGEDAFVFQTREIRIMENEVKVAHPFRLHCGDCAEP